MDNRSNIALEAAQKAGEVVKNYFRGTFDISTKKNDRDLVTSADLACEKVIIETIRKYFPQDKILSEETVKDDINSEHLWIIDPIDGTGNFVKGLPLFCISIAYASRRRVRLGVVFNPFINELYSAETGRGAYLNKTKKLAVSTNNTIRQAMVSFDYSSVDEYRKEIQQVTSSLPLKVRGMRILGVSALEFCWVGAGYLDAYLSRGAHPWDVAAGALIVEEAGGVVTDWHENPWELDCGNFLASNGYVHREFIKDILSHAKI